MEPLLALLNDPNRAAWLEFAGSLGHHLAHQVSVADLEAAQVKLSKVNLASEANRASVGALNALISGFLQQKHADASFEREALESDIDVEAVDLQVLRSTLTENPKKCLLIAGAKEVFVAAELVRATKLGKEQVSLACSELRKHQLIEPLGKGADGRTRPHRLTRKGLDLWLMFSGQSEKRTSSSKRSLTDKVVL